MTNKQITYKPTHRSVRDGSEAMKIGGTHSTITLINENGDVWTNMIGMWEPIPAPEPGEQHGLPTPPEGTDVVTLPTDGETPLIFSSKGGCIYVTIDSATVEVDEDKFAEGMHRLLAAEVSGNPGADADTEGTKPEYPVTILTVSIATYEDDGTQYTLTFHDGRTAMLGDGDDDYWTLAGVIDRQAEKVAPPPRHVFYYVSADHAGPDAPWSVYREEYEAHDFDIPIEGTQTWVSVHPTERAAVAAARLLQYGYTTSMHGGTAMRSMNEPALREALREALAEVLR